MKYSKRMLTVALTGALLTWGTAKGITYYNLTGSNGIDGSASQTEVSVTDATGKYATFSVNNADITTVGTGVIDPFIRIHADNTNENNISVNQGANCANGADCVEVGYNTDGAVGGSKLDMQFQEADSQGSNWNHTLAVSTLEKTCVTATDCYYTFILDINERNNASDPDKFLTLDQFRIFTSDNQNLEGYEIGAGTSLTSSPLEPSLNYQPSTHTLGGLSAVYDMDTTAAGDVSIGLDYDLHSGSGKGIDMIVKVDADLITGDYIYLFSSFGETGIVDSTTLNCTTNPTDTRCKLPSGDFSQSDGFEEWASLNRNPIAPTLALMVLGLAAMGGVRRLRVAPRFA